MEVIIIIYAIGVIFSLGFLAGANSSIYMRFWEVTIWPIILIVVALRFLLERWRLLYPIWLELFMVLFFGKIVKANEELLNNYYAKIKSRKVFLKKLKIKALKKIAEQNSIELINN